MQIFEQMAVIVPLAGHEQHPLATGHGALLLHLDLVIHRQVFASAAWLRQHLAQALVQALVLPGGVFHHRQPVQAGRQAPCVLARGHGEKFLLDDGLRQRAGQALEVVAFVQNAALHVVGEFALHAGGQLGNQCVPRLVRADTHHCRCVTCVVVLAPVSVPGGCVLNQVLNLHGDFLGQIARQRNTGVRVLLLKREWRHVWAVECCHYCGGLLFLLPLCKALSLVLGLFLRVGLPPGL